MRRIEISAELADAKRATVERLLADARAPRPILRGGYPHIPITTWSVSGSEGNKAGEVDAQTLRAEYVELEDSAALDPPRTYPYRQGG